MHHTSTIPGHVWSVSVPSTSVVEEPLVVVFLHAICHVSSSPPAVPPPAVRGLLPVLQEVPEAHPDEVVHHGQEEAQAGEQGEEEANGDVAGTARVVFVVAVAEEEIHDAAVAAAAAADDGEEVPIAAAVKVPARRAVELIWKKKKRTWGFSFSL